MRIYITGVQGYLGGVLARALTARGHKVSGSTRRDMAPPAGIERLDKLNLAATERLPNWQGFDVLVHAAHDLSADAYAVNTRAAAAMLAAARRDGVGMVLFVSSYAAHARAISAYGRSKFGVESLVRGSDVAVVRPGLVIGNGGLFGRQLRFAKRSPLIPLLDHGRDPVPVLAEADFLQAMTVIIEQGLKGEHNLFQNQLLTMRDLVALTLRRLDRHPILLPIPLGVARFLLASLAFLPLPVGRENIDGLITNRLAPHRSTLDRLVPCATSIEAALDAACSQVAA